MKNFYVKPESLAMDYISDASLCAESNMGASMADYERDSEFNFFGD